MKRLAINAGLVVASIAVCLAVFEGVLSSGALDDVSIHWIPPAYKAQNEAIMAPSDARMARNPMFFNAPVAGPRKSDAVRGRLILLGDSFVWGFGLPYEQGLAEKVRRRVESADPGIEVLPMGRPGWGTLAEVRFLENEGKTFGLFDAGFVLVAFVVNDLDLLDHGWTEYRKKIDWKMPAVSALRRVIPNTVDFATGHIDAAMEVLSDDYGQGNWIEYLWSEPNLEGYGKVLDRMKAALDAAGVPFAVALLPANPNSDYYRPKFELMASMLRERQIPFIDLLPSVEKAFSGGDYGTGYRKLWANPGDGHPGDAVTTVLADGIAGFLNETGVLARLGRGESGALSRRLQSLPRCPATARLGVEVTRFTRYALAAAQAYLRVEGVGFELDGGDVRPLADVFLSIGGGYFSALPRIPVGARMPGGRDVKFNGFFIADVPVPAGGAASLDAIAAVTISGCAVVRPIRPGRAPKDAVPPGLDDLPVIRFDRILGG